MRKPRRGDEATLEIVGLSPRGVGLATHDKWRVEVPRTLPGDVVQVVLGKPHRRTIRSRVREVITARPDRQEPRCRHFGQAHEERICGGCSLQALPHETQLQLKAQQLEALLAANGHDTALIRPPIGTSPWYYRNKMELSFGRGADGELALGLHPPGWKYEVFAMSECFLMSDALAPLAQSVSAWAREKGLEIHRGLRDGGFLRTLTVREGKNTGDRLVELTTTADETVMSRAGVVTAQEAVSGSVEAVHRAGVPVTTVYWTQQLAAKGVRTTLTEHLLEGPPLLSEVLQIGDQPPLRFAIHPRAFFQPNTEGAEQVYQQVVQAAALGAGEGGARVMDLYCGTGTIALCLARTAAHVIGIELQPDAVENARRNAALNNIDNVTFYAGDVSKVLAEHGLDQPGAAEVVVVDPPRSGLGATARQRVGSTGASRLVYVSCNPEALASDLIGLAHDGWHPRYFQPIDQFPQTAHIETVAVLER